MRLSKNLSGCIILMLMAAALADGQYFGQNRVRFEPLDSEVIETSHFNIHYNPEEREAAHIVGRMAAGRHGGISFGGGERSAYGDDVRLLRPSCHFAIAGNTIFSSIEICRSKPSRNSA